MRVLLPLLLLGTTSLAQVNECQEVFAECREDCSIEHSSMKGNAPAKLNKCIKKCQKKLTGCEERELETKTNALEAGSLDKTPTSRDVDEAGLPTRTSGKKSASDDDVRRPSPGDDLRDDRPAPVAEEPKKSKKPAEKTEEPEPKRPPREEVRASELPRSSRTELKVDDRDAKKSEPVKESKPSEPIVAKRSEPETTPTTKQVEEPPPPKTEKKKDDLPPAPKKPKEEDHDDLRNY